MLQVDQVLETALVVFAHCVVSKTVRDGCFLRCWGCIKSVQQNTNVLTTLIRTVNSNAHTSAIRDRLEAGKTSDVRSFVWYQCLNTQTSWKSWAERTNPGENYRHRCQIEVDGRSAEYNPCRKGRYNCLSRGYLSRHAYLYWAEHRSMQFLWQKVSLWCFDVTLRLAGYPFDTGIVQLGGINVSPGDSKVVAGICVGLDFIPSHVHPSH